MSEQQIDLNERLRSLIKSGLAFSDAKSVFAEFNTEFDKALIQAALDDGLYEDVQIDDETVTSVGDERSGWVLAWIHTSLPDESKESEA